MLLRSSSLGSLLPSYTESNYRASSINSPITCPPNILSFQGALSPMTSPRAITSPSFMLYAHSDSIPNSRLQRVHSTGTLDVLLPTTCKNLDEFTCLTVPKKYHKPHFPLMQPIPACNESSLCEEDEEEHLSIPGGNGGGNEGRRYKGRGSDNSSDTSVKEYYMRTIKENPGNPLFLSNYAQFLHQTNDLEGAEEYYARAILADSSNSQILSGYAQVVWKLHRDEERASSYFQRARQAEPKDSQMLGAYASFLWDTHQPDNRAISTSG